MFRVITGEGRIRERGKPERRLRLVADPGRTGVGERKERAARPPRRPLPPTYDDAA